MRRLFLSATAVLLCLASAGFAQISRPASEQPVPMAPKPDLKIRQVLLNDMAGGPHNLMARVFVINVGAGPAGASHLGVRAYHPNGMLIPGSEHEAATPALAPGAGAWVNIPTAPHVHPRRLVFKADVRNQVGESNENNNTAERAVP